MPETETDTFPGSYTHSCHYFQYHKCMYELQRSTSNNALQAHNKFTMSSSLERAFTEGTGSVLLWNLQLYFFQLFCRLYILDFFFFTYLIFGFFLIPGQHFVPQPAWRAVAPGMFPTMLCWSPALEGRGSEALDYNCWPGTAKCLTPLQK